jgi:hypothetical protein
MPFRGVEDEGSIATPSRGKLEASTLRYTRTGSRDVDRLSPAVRVLFSKSNG